MAAGEIQYGSLCRKFAERLIWEQQWERGTRTSQLKSWSIYLYSLRKKNADRVGRLRCSSIFSRYLNNFFFSSSGDAPSSMQIHGVRRNMCICMNNLFRPGKCSSAFAEIMWNFLSSFFSIYPSQIVSLRLHSRGRWTAGLCRARLWTASLPWCLRASAVPAVSPTPARPTPSATTSPRRARTSTTSHASVAPPGLNMAPSAPCASAR